MRATWERLSMTEQKFIVSGFDAFGRPMTEEITMPYPCKRRRLDRLRWFIMRWTPGVLQNFWYRIGWSKFRRIKRIVVAGE